jgi:hypothetical protein
VLEELKKGAAVNIIETMKIRDGYLGATRLANTRMDKLSEIIQQEHVTTCIVYTS